MPDALRRTLRVGWVLVFLSAASCAAPPVRNQGQFDFARELVGRSTTEDRLSQYGNAANERMRPFFASAGIDFPPASVVLVGLKYERELQVYAGRSPEELSYVRSYPILAASGFPGPKLAEGDRQVPEGIYEVESLNPNSRHHLALRVGYPNAYERQIGEMEDRADLGGDIMIHGGASSAGCLAIGDTSAEELFILAAQVGIEQMEVVIVPVDFRLRPQIPAEAWDVPDAATRAVLEPPDWTPGLYRRLRARLAALPLPSEPERVGDAVVLAAKSMRPTQ